MAKLRRTRKVKAKWTVMVYMAAGDSPELEGHAVRDLREMQRAGFGDEVQVVALIKRNWPGRAEAYQIDAEGVHEVPIELPDDNMGSRDTLLAFLNWTHEVFEAPRYFLILWGHAYGLGFGRDHGEALTLKDLKFALDRFKTKREGIPLELLGANACAMSYAEAAYELRNSAAYLVASQIAVPFAGWPYDWILRQIGSLNTPEDVGRLVVDRYVTHYSASPDGRQVAMSLVNLAVAPGLKRKVNALAKALTATLMEPDPIPPLVGHRLLHLRNAFLATAAGDVRPLIDAVDLCDELLFLCYDLTALEWSTKSKSSSRSLDELRTAAEDLRGFLTPEVDQKTGEETVIGEPGSLVVFHKRHPDLHGLHGLGIYAPFVTDAADLKSLELIDEKSKTKEAKGRSAYHELALVRNTPWEALVFDRLRLGLPDEILETIEDSGAASPAERAAVAQMLTSVDSMFGTVDRRLAAAQATTLRNARPDLPSPNLVGPHKVGMAPNRAQALGRLGGLRLLPRTALADILEAARQEHMAAKPARMPGPKLVAPPEVTPARPTLSSVDAGVRSLKSLEKMLTDLERAVFQTLTHGRFGLGPSRLTINGFTKPDMGRDKPDMGKPDMGRVKPDMGKPDMGKPDMGKPDMGIWIGTGFGSSTPAAIITNLFAEVGLSMRQFESAVADVESAAALLMLGHADVGPFAKDDVEAQDRDTLARAFRIAAEASADARRTLRRVLANPSYGFGPGAVEFTAEDRSELARVGGLNGNDLTLL